MDEDVRTATIVSKLRQAANYWELGIQVTALEVLKEAYALMKDDEDGGEEDGNHEDGPPGPHQME